VKDGADVAEPYFRESHLLRRDVDHRTGRLRLVSVDKDELVFDMETLQFFVVLLNNKVRI
jgi:hypothetical protein